MDMEFASLEVPLVDAQLLGMAADVGEGDLRRLLHHVAQLPGQDESALAGFHPGGLDEQYVSACARHGQSRCDTRRRGPGCGLLEDLLAAESVADGVQVDLHSLPLGGLG